jgi:hypothetical protein
MMINLQENHIEMEMAFQMDKKVQILEFGTCWPLLVEFISDKGSWSTYYRHKKSSIKLYFIWILIPNKSKNNGLILA